MVLCTCALYLKACPWPSSKSYFHHLRRKWASSRAGIRLWKPSRMLPRYCKDCRCLSSPRPKGLWNNLNFWMVVTELQRPCPILASYWPAIAIRTLSIATTWDEKRLAGNSLYEQHILCALNVLKMMALFAAICDWHLAWTNGGTCHDLTLWI